MFDEMKAAVAVLEPEAEIPAAHLPPPAEAPPRLTLQRTIFVAAFAALVGMTFGAAGLSSTFSIGTWDETLSVLPLIGMLVTLAGGWTGAMLWLAHEENE
jgi:hypothetical protein